MKLIRYKPNVGGIRQLRASREIDEHLEARARLVAAGAKTVYRIRGDADIEVEVVQQGSDTRAPRARVAVIARSPKAIRIEAQQRVLGSALALAGGDVKGLKRVKRARVQGPKKPRAPRRRMARDPDEIHPDA